MAFPAPSTGATLQTIHEEGKLPFRPDGNGRWVRSSPLGVIDKYYGGKNGEIIHISDFGIQPRTRISGHWSVQPDGLANIRFNVNALGVGWLDPTNAAFFGEDAVFLRCADASWREADFSSGGQPNDSSGYVLNWSQGGDDWAIKSRTSGQVRFDFHKLNPNYCAFRWDLLYITKSSRVATLDGIMTLQVSFQNIQSIAFNCSQNVIAGAIHMEGF